MKKILLLMSVMLTIFSCTDKHSDKDIRISFSQTDDAIDLSEASIVFDDNDSKTVKLISNLLAGDIMSVTGHNINVGNEAVGQYVIMIGTIQDNRLIHQMWTKGLIDLDPLENSTECFIIKTIDDPMPGVKRALVIAGSDRRGVAYGAFTLSESIGVTPWTWWADVPVEQHEKVWAKADYTSKSPSVRYRGFFINDEDWGIQPWAALNYEKELGDIGPKTYARVCELILRLKGNMLAPAMHACTGAFYTHPENKEVADEYGIIMTTSHCEPLLFNNASTLEWDPTKDGEWNYITNKQTIYRKLDHRVSEAYIYENIYTLAMRGLHDQGMRGNLNDDEKIKNLENAINDQREILSRYIERPLDEIPQIFIPYKEALDIYVRGLKVPKNVTLVWPDDNYGYIKRLSNKTEQIRSGKSGVYYHISYLGAPHDYLWICTTPPMLMYEELKKAYDTGADRYWLLNVGDIKPMELGIDLFFRMAYEFDSFNYDNVNEYQAHRLSDLFGMNLDVAQQWLDQYYRLAWSRKPEFMGWEREWDSREYSHLKDTEYSFQNYNEAQQRIKDYANVQLAVLNFYNTMPTEKRNAFFQMFLFPVSVARYNNDKFMYAQLNHELYEIGNLSDAEIAAQHALEANDSINSLIKHYNSMNIGKWDHYMAIPPGYTALYQNMPELNRVNGVRKDHADLKEYVEPNADRAKVERCTVIDLSRPSKVVETEDHTIRILNGIGYDWKSLQLGQATQTKVSPKQLNGTRAEYVFKTNKTETLKVIVYSVPTFPLYDGHSTQFGVSIDNSEPKIAEYVPVEYSPQWKTNVLRNGALFTAEFAVKPNKKHLLTLTCGDPGIIIQKVIIDWGGLKESYLGPVL